MLNYRTKTCEFHNNISVSNIAFFGIMDNECGLLIVLYYISYTEYYFLLDVVLFCFFFLDNKRVSSSFF